MDVYHFGGSASSFDVLRAHFPRKSRKARLQPKQTHDAGIKESQRLEHHFAVDSQCIVYSRVRVKYTNAWGEGIPLGPNRLYSFVGYYKGYSFDLS